MKVSEVTKNFLEKAFIDEYDSLIRKLDWIKDYTKYAEDRLVVLNNLVECRKEIDPLITFVIKKQ